MTNVLTKCHLFDKSLSTTRCYTSPSYPITTSSSSSPIIATTFQQSDHCQPTLSPSPFSPPATRIPLSVLSSLLHRGCLEREKSVVVQCTSLFSLSLSFLTWILLFLFTKLVTHPLWWQLFLPVQDLKVCLMSINSCDILLTILLQLYRLSFLRIALIFGNTKLHRQKLSSRKCLLEFSLLRRNLSSSLKSLLKF